MLSKSQRCLIARLIQETSLSTRKIAQIAKCSRPSVAKCQSVIANHGLSWQEMEHMSSEQLDGKFYPSLVVRSSKKHHPNHEDTHQALMKNKLLRTRNCWLRHCEKEGQHAVGKSTFYDGYRKFRQMQKLSMRMEYNGGEIAQVDYAGTVLRYKNKKAGKDVVANFFFGLLCRSSYLFALATPGQTTQDWIDGHIAFLEHIGGVMDTIVPDNPKALVTKTNPEKVLNANYEAFSKWYGVSILPARVGHPQDKAGVENGIGDFKTTVLADMKDMTFFSLDEINAHLRREAERFSNRRFQKRNSTRKIDFEAWDKPHLKPLPEKRFEIIEKVSRERVTAEHVLLFDEHYYSVPHTFIGKWVDVHVTKHEVKIFYDMQEIAKHRRSDESGGMTRVKAHMPVKHQHMIEHPVEHYLQWACDIGPYTQALIRAQFEGAYKNSMRANSACRRIQHVFEKSDMSNDRFERACAYVTRYCSPTVTNLKHTLASRLYEDNAVAQSEYLLSHENVRGSAYYNVTENDGGRA